MPASGRRADLRKNADMVCGAPSLNCKGEVRSSWTGAAGRGGQGGAGFVEFEMPAGHPSGKIITRQ